jgi:glycosyltransferase involved in cell wall biosynthesis
MTKNELYQTKISPVPDGTPRPLWSVMIPTYNCAKYLHKTLASVLAQDPGVEVMQIEVIDDYSTKDDPAAVVEELAHGRVGFYRQPNNVGHIKNFQTCLERSRGKIVHLLHGDDYVRYGFYQKLQRAFEENPEVGAAFCRYIYMDQRDHWQYISWLEQPESGILSNWLERIAVEQRIQTPSIVVRRDVYEKVGMFDSRLACAEDWEMWVRIAANYPFWYEVEPLAVYRVHSNSNTGRHANAGKNIQYIRKAISLIKEHLADDCADRLSKTALKKYAFYALDEAEKLAGNGNTYDALSHVKEALRCCYSLKIIRSSAKLSTRIIYQHFISNVRQTKSVDA